MTSTERDPDGERPLVGSIPIAPLGGHAGAALFLGSLCFFLLFLQNNPPINDSNAVMTGLANMMDGHLSIREFVFGSRATPGITYNDGRYYAENFGQLFVSLPLALALSALDPVVDRRLLVLGPWCLAVAGACYHAWASVGERRRGARVGLVAAVLLYLLNLAAMTPQFLGTIHYMALQVPTACAAALGVVACYRLVGDVHGERVGIVAGTVLAVASPLAVFATLPLRHAWVAMLALVAMYWFYRSRDADSSRTALRFRALAYVPVGLTAWVFAPDAFLLFVPLAVVDLVTARSNAPRRLAVVGAVFLCSALPFFVTNTLISGNPLRPPILMKIPPEVVETTTGGQNTYKQASDSGLIAGVLGVLGAVVQRVVATVSLPVTAPDDLYHALVRGAGGEVYVPGEDQTPEEAAAQAARNLALMESHPIVGALVGGLAHGLGRVRSDRSVVGRWLGSPEGQVDAVALGYLGMLALFYLQRLPDHAQIMLRYLLPGMAVAVYLVFRLPFVRAVVRERLRTALWTYAGVVLIGTQIVVVLLVSPDVGVQQATSVGGSSSIATVGLLTLGSGVLTAAWSVLSASDRDRTGRVGAVVLGIVVGATTVVVLLFGAQFTNTGGIWIPMVERVEDALQFGG